MARRTTIFQKVPWTGGVNTSVDSGVLSPNDLVQADNVQFATSGSRLKREGFDYFDTAMPAVIKRSSSGTTRTLQFASSINIAGTVDHILVVGEKITVAGASVASYNGSFTVATITTTTNTNDTITYTGVGSLAEALTTETAATVTRNYDIIGVHDLWYFDAASNTMDQELVAFTSQGFLFKYDANGKRTQITMSGSGATALVSSTFSSCDMRTFNNKLILTMDGAGNTPKYYDPMVANEWKDLASNAPDASIMMEHLGRLWMNDKDNPDRLHYSETFDETLWQGLGDSGAIDFAIGVGDPTGISVIMPPLKGRMIVCKGERVAQLLGDSPETFFFDDLSRGVGGISHKAAVSFDMDDVLYMSRRGIHSVVATDQFGDFAGRFLSSKIQPTFNEWSAGRLQYTQGTYISKLNTVAWTVAEDGQTKANAVWLFNPTIPGDNPTQPGEWFRWPNLYLQSISTRLSSDTQRIIGGNNAGRIMIGQNGEYTDFETDGISYRLKSGTIYPDGNSQTIKGFKKFGLLFRPRGRFNFTVYVKVDSLPAQAMTFEQSVTGELLGSEFVLGQSVLGNTTILAPYVKDLEGFGRGMTIEIFQTGTDAQIEVYGFLVEFESADIADEVIQDG